MIFLLYLTEFELLYLPLAIMLNYSRLILSIDALEVLPNAECHWVAIQMIVLLVMLLNVDMFVIEDFERYIRLLHFESVARVLAALHLSLSFC